MTAPGQPEMWRRARMLTVRLDPKHHRWVISLHPDQPRAAAVPTKVSLKGMIAVKLLYGVQP
jgi:hypothetical protein